MAESFKISVAVTNFCQISRARETGRTIAIFLRQKQEMKEVIRGCTPTPCLLLIMGLPFLNYGRHPLCVHVNFRLRSRTALAS